jgi:hypothetical protein
MAGFSPVRAQEERRSAEVPMTQFVPASAGVFLHVSYLGEVNEALHRANVWRILSRVAGPGEGPSLPGDIQEVVAEMLGSATIRSPELINAEIGLAAVSLDRFAEAVLFVRVPDDSVVDRWFPERRRTASATIGDTRSFRMDDGLVVSVRDGIVAVGRRFDGDRVLPDATYLMRGRSVARLDETAAYARARSFLPTSPLATLYVSQGTGGKESTSSAGGSAGEPHVLVALYEADGGLDIAVRGTLRGPGSQGRISVETVERFLKLPRSTLFAIARTVDVATWLGDAPAEGTEPNLLKRYVRSLIGLVDGNGTVVRSLPLLGPDIIFAWDQNLDARGVAPQLAMLMQSSDGSQMMTVLSGIVQRLIELIGRVDAGEAVGTLRILEHRHLGIPYACLPLRRYSETSRLPFGRLLGSVEPCWAADSEWVMITLGRDHLVRILDAQRGMAPSLSSVREMGVMRRRRADLNAVAMMHGELAAEVLDDWLNHAAHGAGASLLSPGWWDELSDPGGGSRRSVGIGMRAQQEPGVVVVARVHPDSAADGVVEVDDRILGIDGAVLALDGPNADLRRRLYESRAFPGPTLRVQRDDSLVDVVLPVRESAGTLPRLGVSPVEAVQELASLIRSIPFASFAVTSLDDSHFAARVTVRFASETTERIPPE